MTDVELNARHGKAWDAEEDRQIYEGFLAGNPVNAMAYLHQRSAGGIRARLRRLGLIDQNGVAVEPPPPFSPPPRRRSTQQGGSGDKNGLHLLLAATVADGWHIEVRSNRPLSKQMIDRIMLLLEGSVAGTEPEVPF